MEKRSARQRLREFFSIFRTEIKYIFSDSGVILIMFGAVIIYSTVYSFAYSTEVLRDVPVAVVNNDNTQESREFIRKLDATPNIDVAYAAPSLDEAKDLFLARKVYGIIVIPHDFAKDIYSGITTDVVIYADGSYLLIYKQVLNDLTNTVLYNNAQIKALRLMQKGAGMEQALAVSNPVIPGIQSTFNPYLGYGSFAMPAILILIIQQTLLIGIGMIGGTWREKNLYRKLIPEEREYLSALPILFGKTAAYFLSGAAVMLFVFGFQYKLFHFPMNGHFGDIAMFLLPYLLSVIFLGLAISSVLVRRENSIILILFTSIPLLMISGISVPREAMPEWLYELGKIIPSSNAINGFIRIQSAGATLREVFPEYMMLWILTGIYFLLAALEMRSLAHKVYVQE
ncbi:MAG: ABC transporter permease [Rikenellaceae bacterium]|nr:ABC transporter permease [Rikenellaceae bacterium]